MHADYAVITPWGQLQGAVIMFFVLGFVPGYVAAGILKRMGRLRVPAEVELAGLDIGDNDVMERDIAGVVAAEREAAKQYR
jgi:ammonia channel protein AmtB